MVDTDVSHEVEKRLSALEEAVGISPEPTEEGATEEEVPDADQREE
jgi:hypothetical protein